MQLLLATLCDFASIYHDKLCVQGCFDALCAPQFPVTHPQCSLALRIMFEPHEAGSHQFQIEFKDDAGNLVIPAFPADQNLEINFPPGAVPFVTRNLVMHLQMLQFDRPGIFRIHITLDQVEIASLPLRLTRLEELRAAASPAG